MTNTVLLIILAIPAALAVSTWSRVPWARARAKARREKRILARKTHPATRPRTYRRVPDRDTCALTPSEVTAYGQIAEEMADLDYAWVTRAMQARREAQQ